MKNVISQHGLEMNCRLQLLINYIVWHGKVNKCEDEQIKKDWEYLQSSDHFYYMATKFFSDGAVHAYFNPYETPYDAFMNYMNVLSDFEIRLKKWFPDTAEQDQIFKLGITAH